MKAIIFARVSTEEQKREGYSLPAQILKMREYCFRKNIQISKEYMIDESSTTDERRKFYAVIEEIKKSKEKTILIIETIDRLQRSFKESVVIDDLRKKDLVEVHFLRENLILSVESNSSDIIRWDMGVLVAKSYGLQMKDNMKRSIEHKLRNGEWVHPYPYGYKKINKEVVLDEQKALIVKKAYELYATAAYSMDLLREKLKKDYGIDWSKGFLDAVLKRDFYYGVMKRGNQSYPHIYPTIITKTLFDKVQQIKDSFAKKPFKYAGNPFVYRGLIRCGHCGNAITAEEQKGHVYYHCTQSKGKHGAAWLREDRITEEIATFFRKLSIPQNIVDEIINGLKAVHDGKVEFRKTRINSLTKDREVYAKRCEKIYLDRLDGRITDEEYDKFRQMFRDKISEIDSQIAMLQESEDNYYITAELVLDLANRSPELFENSNIEEKRQLIKIVLSNLTIEGDKLRLEANKPFDLIANFDDRQGWCA